jgi:ankyrin repeat protein
MSAFHKYIMGVLITGILTCHSAIIISQEVTGEKEESRIWKETHEAEPDLQIDTSDYLPSFYETSLNYNLMIASSKGYESEIDRLIGKGAEINTETSSGITPLIFAVINNHVGAVRTLLKYNPVLDKVTSSYETPLIIAVKNNNAEICEVLIRAGAEVDFPDRNGATPLHYATINGYLEITDLL